MIPLRFTIKGSLGVLAGLGKDELSADLKSLIPSDAVTVAIRGDNGSGKSTILNLAMVPWREPPVLPGSVYDEFGSNGSRELEFTHAGKLYRSTIIIKRTAKTKGQKAFLHVWDDSEGSWLPVTLPNNTVSDGKTTTYDECLEGVLGPQSLYYLSAFRAQGAPRLAEYADPKGLMKDLLALDEPERLMKQAKEVVTALRRQFKSVETEFDLLNQKVERLSDYESQVVSLEADAPPLAEKKSQDEQALMLAKKDLESIIDSEVENEKIRKVRAGIEEQITENKNSANNSIREIDRDASKEISRYQAQLQDLQYRETKINDSAQAAQKILDQRTEIEAAESGVLEGKYLIEEQEKLIESLNEDGKKAIEIHGKLDTLKARRTSNERAGASAAARKDDLETRSKLTSEVPCGAKPPYDTCPLLSNAISAGEQVVATIAELEQSRKEWKFLTGEIKGLEAQLEPISRRQQELVEAKSKLNKIKANVIVLQKTAELRSKLNLASDTLAEASGQINEIDTKRAEIETEHQKEINIIDGRREAVRSKLHENISKLEAELAALPEPNTDSRIEAQQTAVMRLQQIADLSKQTLDEHNALLAGTKAEVKLLQEQVDAGQTLRDYSTRLSTEISEWSMLAIGLQGVIDLSIEDAGPAISGAANNLLSQAYGPRFTTSIVTQKEQANGKLVECFDITVMDADSGLESSILQKSGGESVWLDKALTDAVGLHLQDSVGIHYECSFADESEDGLTQDRKNMFYRMDRAALQAGNYQRKFFISHNAQAWETADAVIDMDELR